MEDVQILSEYSDLIALSEGNNQPVLVALLTGDYTCLMCEVLESLATDNSEAFQLLKLSGENSLRIQTELSILNLPALIILHDGKIKAIFKGLMAKHEIEAVLSELNY